MPPAKYPGKLEIYRGDPFSFSFVVNPDDPWDLTDWEGRAQIRPTTESDEAWDWDVTISSPTEGQVTLHLSGSQTAEFTPTEGADTWAWDVELLSTEPGAEWETYIFGRAVVKPDVTRVP